jgi:hypothetical protein
MTRRSPDRSGSGAQQYPEYDPCSASDQFRGLRRTFTAQGLSRALDRRAPKRCRSVCQFFGGPRLLQNCHTALLASVVVTYVMLCAPFAYFTRRESTMRENVGAKVRECLGHAEACAQRARAEPNPAFQRDLIEMERCWLQLARGYQSFAWLQPESQGGQLSDRLQQLKVEHRRS